MIVFDKNRMEPALDGMEPAPAAKVGMENENNDTQGSQNRRGPVTRASTRNRSCNLKLGEEDNNLAEGARTNVLTDDMDGTDPYPPWL
jgi:hypothetical protein